MAALAPFPKLSKRNAEEMQFVNLWNRASLIFSIMVGNRNRELIRIDQICKETNLESGQMSSKVMCY